jgi:dephospho-CoA kinase
MKKDVLTNTMTSAPEEMLRESRELRDVQMFVATTDKRLLQKIAQNKGKDWDKMNDEEQDRLIREFLFTEPVASPNVEEFNALIQEAHKQAKAAGLKQKDIKLAVAKVRRRE